MESSQLLSTIQAVHADARQRRLFFQTATDTELRGRTITLDGRRVVSFSSCSYLGLEHHPAVIAGVHDAVDRYGVQFSCSRGYVSAPMYAEVEAMLSGLFGGHVLVTPSTTMGHLIALPVLAMEKDAIVLDHQVHHSVHVGANQARAGGATVEVVRHDELERACEVVRRLAVRHRTVWFATDGVFSMYGDLAPLQVIRELLAVAPNVRLYVDDAHGMSWAGKHGRGSFLDRFPLSERVVVATSFAKGFGAGGGCLVFADEQERERVRLSGGPLVFSGPMQPPMLGAVRASAALHLSDEIVGLQEALRLRVDHANTRLVEAGITPISINESPIVFLPCGMPRVAFRTAERLLEEGVYVNCSVYPTVPMKRAGIRFTLTAAHSLAEIDGAIDALARHLPAALAEERLSEARLAAFFDRALPAESASLAPSPRGPRLRVETAETIQAVDRAEWDRLLGARAHCSWDAMATVEAVYGAPDARPEHRWSFRYVVVRDERGRPVAATVLTTLLNKDDMLSREEVSQEVEARRVADPYFLTSTVVMIGHNLSEGDHLWLDRTGPWREALRLVLAVANEEVERGRAASLLVRDLPAGDEELDAFMLGEGLVRVPMLDSHVLDLDGRGEDAWHAGLERVRRQQLRPVREQADKFEVTVHGAGHPPLSEADVARCTALYAQLAARKLRLNLFAFPDTLLSEVLRSPAWEVGVMRVRTEAGGTGEPVVFWAAHVHDGHYSPLFCGIDEGTHRTHNTYRQMLLQIVRRARAIGATRVHLGMDAEIEKRRFGARTVPTCIYAQSRDHWSGSVLRDIVAEVALRADHARAAK